MCMFRSYNCTQELTVAIRCGYHWPQAAVPHVASQVTLPRNVKALNQAPFICLLCIHTLTYRSAKNYKLV